MTIQNKAELVQWLQQGEAAKFLFFWGHTSKSKEVGKECLSQWYPASFVVKHETFASAEHYMMVAKARLFNDEAIAQAVFATDDPGKAKALGRQIEGFSDTLWNQYRFEIVVEGNVHKFSQNAALSTFLLTSKNRILVEASPVDRIWGIGLAADDKRANNPAQWRGENLLGFALMRARSILAEAKTE